MFVCNVCKYTYNPLFSENAFYIKDKNCTIHICDDCLSKREKKCCRCNTTFNLAFIYFPERFGLDIVCCENCMYDEIERIENSYGEVGDCEINHYFPEFLLKNEEFEYNYPGVLDHQRY